MAVVWLAFLASALMVGGIAVALFCYRGPHAVAARRSVRWLAGIALGTALYPMVLQPAGFLLWVVGYTVFVVVMTALMVIDVLHAARRGCRDNVD